MTINEVIIEMVLCPKCKGSGENVLVLDEGRRVNIQECDSCGGAGAIGIERKRG